MQALSFWHDCIGRHIAPQLSPKESPMTSLPTRMLKKGVGQNRLGAGINAFYIAQPGDSCLIGKFAVEDMPCLRFIDSEKISGEKYIATWLAESAPLNSPWMIGVIGKASPIESFYISQPPGLCAFSQASSGFEFDLRLVKDAVKLIGETPWKKEVAPAIHAYEGKLRASATGNQGQIDKANDKLLKMFAKTPEVRTLLIELNKLPIKARSGEYQILSWYNRER